MEKQTFNKILALALPLALAACGGGGGDSPAADNKPTPNQPQNNTDNVANKYGLTAKDHNASLAESKNLQGLATYNGYVFASKVSNFSANDNTTLSKMEEQFKRQLPTNSKLGTVFIPVAKEATDIGERAPITIGGVDYYRGNKIYSSGTSYKDFNYFLASNSKYKYIQFGLGKNNDYDPILIGYYRAKTTPEASMPNSGTFTYQGEFVTLPEFVGDNNSPIGVVTASVNFANKDAYMLFSTHNGYRGEISAEIIGSTLNGKTGSKAVTGIFGGPNANEITGTYGDTDANILGLYGAARQQ